MLSALKIIISLLLITSLNLVPIALLYLHDSISLAYSPSRKALPFEVKSRWSARQIGIQLAKMDMVEYPMHFEWAAHWLHKEEQLRAGRYLIPGDTPPLGIVELLIEGAVLNPRRLTIPEGFTNKEIFDRVYQVCGIEPSAIEKTSHNPDLLTKYGIPGDDMQGYLFPETYDVAGFTSGDESRLIERMLREFKSVAKRIGLNEDKDLPNDLSPYEIIILASIIEREAHYVNEYPQVSAVFHNRLKRDMKLQSCATVHYAMGRWGGDLKYDDLELDSPYNTYKIKGLPPAPICNPGRASLQAALNPAATKDLYFIARGDGKHHFSRTLKEHNRAKRKYGK
jgi:peptidoglycan lytic transglycosylase G